MPMDYPGRLAATVKGAACGKDINNGLRGSNFANKSATTCGGAILKDDVKSRSLTLPIQKTVPSDSFYDAAAFRNTCVACNPENS